mmetsp:Transcript_9888/g.21736  ORF Transcript_9888/g.21736 Transcript_9888/m.21736 type:complete len:152 (-) Transcript_9888:124-579(-)
MGRKKSAPAPRANALAKQLDTLEAVQTAQDNIGKVAQRVQMLEDQEFKLAQKVQQAKLRIRRCGVTVQALSDYPDDAKAFTQVGKMFIQSPMKDCVADLNSTAQNLIEDLPKWQVALDAFKAKREASQKEFNELKSFLDKVRKEQEKQAAK